MLEALVALVIVAVAVTAGATLAADATRAVGRVGERETAMRRASAFLDAVALWPRDDLDRHLGDRAEAAWTLRIARPAPALYVVALLPAPSADSGGGDAHPLLETALYRPPDTPNAYAVARP